MSQAKLVGVLNKEGMKALSDGDYMNAQFLLTQALDKCKAFRSALNEAKIRNNLALVMQTQGFVEKAATNFKLAMSITEREAGTDTGLYRKIKSNFEKLEAA
ncbi:hypothetical protein [Salidesulfovibrio brasiliensis]|uniref:hypothetical protein n=1 Tax=Salidesulfovibrio brasiliensis TaxID=221711 RepID=UPI0006CF3D60|nr:hypothetical protein [Salidesulfovibrio brasiliensis]